MNNPSTEQPATHPICPSCGKLLHRYHICQVGVRLPEDHPASAQGVDLERLREALELVGRQTPVLMSNCSASSERWEAYNLLWNNIPTLLSLAQQSATAASELKDVEEALDRAQRRQGHLSRALSTAQAALSQREAEVGPIKRLLEYIGVELSGTEYEWISDKILRTLSSQPSASAGGETGGAA